MRLRSRPRPQPTRHRPRVPPRTTRPDLTHDVNREVGEPATPHTGVGGLVRLRLDLGYDGTAYAGWAVQPGQRTVQGAVETAVATVLRLEAPARLTVAGRTDAGVHARGQVAHVDVVPVDDDTVATLARRLDGVLPPDIRMRGVRRAPTG